ncbi:hypothetical protein LIER_41573 [Lithospermum erythrorhizon]|uniref:ATP-dependent DNA helicase n=1 Tax=Lithospermum erythrorhizon TaxID=34254 RepID=A0AAV3REZ0_LITER
MLTEFFRTNATDSQARKLELLYKEFPQYYVWQAQPRIWTKRKQGATIGRFLWNLKGGTGKSFLYKVLLAHIRSRGFIGIIVASSGIASSEFLGGRTAHSRFKIPIDTKPGNKCQISFQGSEANLIRNSRIIIWDEAPMADKSSIHALHLLL